MTVGKALYRIIWTTGLLVWGLYFILVLFSQFDEQQLPEVQQVLAYRLEPSAIPTEENGFYALMGFAVPAGQAPYGAGLVAVHSLRDRSAWGECPSWNECFDAKPLEFKGDPPDMPSRLSEYEGLDGVPELLRDNAELVERYAQLTSYSAMDAGPVLALTFQGLCPPFPLPLGQVYEVHRLFLAQIARDVLEGAPVSRAVDALARDHAFWRMAAAGRIGVMEKAAAALMVWQNLDFLSLLLNAYPHEFEDEALYHTARGMVVPPEADEYSLQFQTRLDLTAILHSLEEKEDEPTLYSLRERLPIEEAGIPAWTLPFIQPLYLQNQTLNNVYRVYAPQLSMQVEDPASRRLCASEFRTYMEGAQPGLHWLRNPKGKLLMLGLSTPYCEIAERCYTSHVLENLMARLHLELVHNAVPPSQTEAFLADLPAELRSPETGKPVGYNATTGRIFMERPHESELRLIVHHVQ